MNNYISNLININKESNEHIVGIEKTIQNIEVKTEKDKANFGNLCVLLRGFRMIADASEAMLINEKVLKDDNGDFYQKIEDEKPSDNVEEPAKSPTNV